MQHCSGGAGPISCECCDSAAQPGPALTISHNLVGQSGAKPNVLKGTAKSLYNNATYNIMYALMDWVVS